jgi:hypothetical protein
MSNLRVAVTRWHRMAVFRTRRGREIRVSLRVCERVLSKAHSKAVEKCFFLWRMCSLQQTHQAALHYAECVLGDVRRASTLKVAKKSIYRMKSLAISTAFKKWKDVIVELSETDAKSFSLKKKIGTIISSTKMRKCAMVFRKWTVFSQEHRITAHYSQSIHSATQKHTEEVTFDFSIESLILLTFLSFSIEGCSSS